MEARAMQAMIRRLKLAQDEVHKATHDQDLIEVPKRAHLDREAEHRKAFGEADAVQQASVSDQ
jgi:hypothetical protein